MLTIKDIKKAKVIRDNMVDNIQDPAEAHRVIMQLFAEAVNVK